jgi:hypothetical protein
MSRKIYRVTVCGGDFREHVEPNNTCLNRAEHTYGPAGYVDWFSWAAARASKGSTQRRCKGCGRYLIWTPERSVMSR